MSRRGLLLLVASAAALLLAPFVGPSLDGAAGEFVLWQLRIPRTVAGILVGSALALSGAVFQALFANALATESTIGTTAGATVGALAGLVLELPLGNLGLPVVTLTAFVGALAASALVATLAASGRARMSDILLAGIAVTLAASALSTALEFAADVRALFASAQWSLGRLPQLGYEGVLLMLPFVVPSVTGLLLLARPLECMAHGEELAHAQGVDVRRVRAAALLLSSLGVAACVAWCGPIAFVGLIVPHLVRLVAGASQRVVLPLSACAGAAFLVLCDTLARVLLDGRELPVGVVTAALGAPALVSLVLRRAR
jgi:iron complex transport system permease protein